MATVDPMRRTKIVATIGPATESKQVLRQLIEAGATTFRLNFSHGDHEDHAERIIAIRQVAQELGVPLADQGAAPWAVQVPGGRSRRLQVAGIEVLDETYNASPESMLAALELLAHQPLAAGGRRYAVLGTMLELGEHSLALHRQVAERAKQLRLDGLVIVDAGAEGEAMQAAAAGLARLARVAEPEAAAVPLGSWLCPGDVVLLKASRAVALERLLPLLGCSDDRP